MLARVLSIPGEQFNVILLFLLGGVYSENLYGPPEADHVKGTCPGPASSLEHGRAIGHYLFLRFQNPLTGLPCLSLCPHDFH